MRKLFLLGLAIAATACIKVDNDLGKGLVDKSLLYDTYTCEFDLADIEMKRASDLSGYSSARVVIGAIRDATFGLTTRESAFTLVPALDTLYLGTNPVAESMDLYFTSDSISCADDAQARILQNIYVTELSGKLDPKQTASCTDIPHGSELITEGIPVYNGSGALNFKFTKDFANKYLKNLREFARQDSIIINREWSDDEITARFSEYTDKLPGIHICTNEPSGIGGRINLFNLSCLSISSNQYYRNNNVAILRYHNDEYGADSTLALILVPGEMAFINENKYLDDNSKFSQYAFNRTTHEKAEGKASDRILVEGGGGLKPVISATELYDKTKALIESRGGSLENTIISKATIILPYEMPEDYQDMKYFPGILSPTIRTTSTDDDGNSYVQFAGLTDASISTEDQGDIDRSNMVYSPDISYHLQEILKRKDLSTLPNADIWLLTIHTETVEETNGNASNNAYLQQLMYASYYNSLYGYGSYGGYGGYGYGGYDTYSNYYNYMMLAQMLSANSQSTYSTTQELDKDRYYRGILCGPSSSRKPRFRVTFAVSKK